MKKYIVCDACYILSDESYEILMKLWFSQGYFMRDIQSYGDGAPAMTDKEGNVIIMHRVMSTNSGDCTVDWLGCDAGNFSLFESETWNEARDHMFRYFDDKDRARSYLEKIIKQS